MPTLLITLAAVPVLAGAVRMAELTSGAEVTPENARFFAAPVPVLLHIVGATLFCVLGAFQFVPGLRRRGRGWHRTAGRLLVPAGLVAALSGLWMTLFYPQPAGDGDLLTGFRLLFGSAMVGCIVLGFAAVLRRNFVRHRAWMIRGYAIGQGAGTQALTHLPWMLFLGMPGETGRALLVAAGWVINLAVAEWIIRGRRTVRTLRSTTGAGTGAGIGAGAGIGIAAVSGSAGR
ncbi:DUF2306 domain-containing protein [Plantactinospora sp. S1510]|uniref:DUF2306 domain-containing protein n=1 Tax=Plantactinospora alkalitolerans TaxID=2789879 RepID=A0ABS0GX51_9ACTN|nr:DUF2306 domain-containing protein [Plantactinospora alkalitolerans]MBF9130766.1 DUF2306 domain-containing protein [Plantactinospora alkalitolerans]